MMQMEVAIQVSKTSQKEVVQLYVRDIAASVTRPVKELKGFEKIFLKAKEYKEVTFQINAADLGFTEMDMKYITEPGEFEIMVGTNSEQLQKIKVRLTK